MLRGVSLLPQKQFEVYLKIFGFLSISLSPFVSVSVFVSLSLSLSLCLTLVCLILFCLPPTQCLDSVSKALPFYQRASKLCLHLKVCDLFIQLSCNLSLTPSSSLSLAPSLSFSSLASSLPPPTPLFLSLTLHCLIFSSAPR